MDSNAQATFNADCKEHNYEYEMQISEGGEADLPEHKEKCKKNHQQFIPIQSFNLEHLPVRDHDLYYLIKAIADLTVKVTVYKTSPNRPEFRPNTNIPYICYDKRGQNTYRIGTGKIKGVRKYKDEDKLCPCNKCKASDKPSKVHWKIDVYTAAHVIVDNIEASHTTFMLFYDSEDSHSKVSILRDEVLVERVDIEKDRCKLSCVTCDENVAHKLEIMVKHLDHVRSKILNKFKESRDIDKLSFIVSHPHGDSKQVSVGHWVDKIQFGREKYDYKFSYTTCTCPGSSGAYVHFVGYNGYLNNQIHSYSSDSGLNYSGVGTVM